MVRAVLVDDEQPALDEMQYILADMSVDVLATLTNSSQVIPKVVELVPDVIFLDIDMPGVNGLEQALKIQELGLGVQIVFVTAYSEYAIHAFQAFPLDYLLKPVDVNRLKLTLRHVQERTADRRRIPLGSPSAVIRCFGRFDAWIEGEPRQHIHFATKQTRELFAFLVDHFEQPVTRSQLLSEIFGGVEDTKTVNLLHVTVYKLRSALENAGLSKFVSIRKNYTLDIVPGVCDYVDFMRFTENLKHVTEKNIEQSEHIANLYSGAYLSEETYSWSDETRSKVDERYEFLLLKIAECHAGSGREISCEQTLLSLQRDNPQSVACYEALLECYMRTGSNDKFIRQFSRYAQLLRVTGDALPRRYVQHYAECRKVTAL